MAKWGEGDPRWIVENREDGKNVNNWHWSEKNFTKWAENRITELLSGLSLDSNLITAITKEITVKGEVTVNTRKQKIIFLYELDVTATFEGKLKGRDQMLKGNISIPYISEENADDEFEVEVSMEGNSKEHEVMRCEVRSVVIPILKEKIPLVLSEMRKEAVGVTKLTPKVAEVPMKSEIQAQYAPQSWSIYQQWMNLIEESKSEEFNMYSFVV